VTDPPIPLDNGVLYPVYQTHGAGIQSKDGEGLPGQERPTYRREILIFPVPSRQARSGLGRGVLYLLDLRYVLRLV